MDVTKIDCPNNKNITTARSQLIEKIVDIVVDYIIKTFFSKK